MLGAVFLEGSAVHGVMRCTAFSALQVRQPPRKSAWSPSTMLQHDRPILVTYIGANRRVNDTGPVRKAGTPSSTWAYKLAVRRCLCKLTAALSWLPALFHQHGRRQAHGKLAGTGTLTFLRTGRLTLQ